VSKGASDSGLTRRAVLKGATVAGAATVGSSLDANAQEPAQPRAPSPITPAPNPAMESGHPREAPIVQGSCGSDYMADVIRSLGIEHVACNPGTSFRGLRESLVNYLKIDWHTCTHEEASVARRTAMLRSRASRCSPLPTARSGCSTPRWRSIMPGAIACPST
jgi:acetolactate synthase-1/2/3 large subunit